MVNNTLSYDAIDSVYADLFSAYMQHNRNAVVLYCNKCQNMNIPNFHERANREAEKIYNMAGIQTYQLESTLDKLPDEVLNNYAVACMNVLYEEKDKRLCHNTQNAYQILSQAAPFDNNDVLYAPDDNNVLTVENFLKVIKYAISIASIIDPENKAYSYANASVLALQGLDDALNNKSRTELTNHALHIAMDFLATCVKDSLTDTNAKRGVAVSALLVNLAIDFLTK